MYKLSLKFGYEFANRTPGYEFPSWVGLNCCVRVRQQFVYEFANWTWVRVSQVRYELTSNFGTSSPKLVRVDLTFWYEFAKVGTSWPKILVRVRQSWYELTSNFGTSSPKLVRVDLKFWYEFAKVGTSWPQILVRVCQSWYDLTWVNSYQCLAILYPWLAISYTRFLYDNTLYFTHIRYIFTYFDILILKYHNKAKFSVSKIYCIW